MSARWVTIALCFCSRHCSSSLLCFCSLVSSGCEDPPRPWSGPPPQEVVHERSAFLPRRDDAPILGAGGADGAAGGGAVPDSEPAAPRARYGGLWASCHEGFAPSSDPTVDVTRLGLMCGPVNGMTKLGATFSGQLAHGASESHAFVARAGDCYRVFAVGSPGVEDLDVTVRSSRMSRLAADDSDDRWPVVDRQRAFCSFDDDRFSAEVHAERGAGRYALEVWRLPRTR